MGETSVIINDEDNNDDDDDDEDDENNTVVIYDPALNYSQESRHAVAHDVASYLLAFLFQL